MKFGIIKGIDIDEYGAEYDISITPQLRIRYDYNYMNDKKDCNICLYFQWLFWNIYVIKEFKLNR